MPVVRIPWQVVVEGERFVTLLREYSSLVGRDLGHGRITTTERVEAGPGGGYRVRANDGHLYDVLPYFEATPD